MRELQANAELRTAEQSRPAPQPIWEAREKLIVALDFPSSQRALTLVDQIEDTCKWFKVGLELYLAAGGEIVENLRRRGHSVFLDLKFHDIPNTVGGAVRSAARFGPQMLTVHAAGGQAMLAAAAEAAASLTDPPKLLAVTVLTSIDRLQLAAIGIAVAPAEQALQLAKLAAASGIHGLVCSPEEAASLHAALPGATLVTPGVRPEGSAVGDQKRVATPAKALAAGADYLVVGRPITQASNPAQAVTAILEAMAAYQNRHGFEPNSAKAS